MIIAKKQNNHHLVFNGVCFFANFVFGTLKFDDEPFVTLTSKIQFLSAQCPQIRLRPQKLPEEMWIFYGKCNLEHQ